MSDKYKIRDVDKAYPGLSPYTQFKVLKPFEVQKSLASPGFFSGQTGFGIQFQSPIGADILIKRGIIAPF